MKAKYLDPIVDARRTVEQKIPETPFWRSLYDPQKQQRLQDLHPYIQRYLDKFPEDYKSIGYNAMRNTLKAKSGMGPVSADYAMSGVGERLKNKLNAIGSPPQEYLPRGVDWIPNPSYPKKIEQAEKKLTGIFKDEIQKGTSPLILQDLTVNGLGYPGRS